MQIPTNAQLIRAISDYAAGLAIVTNQVLTFPAAFANAGVETNKQPPEMAMEGGLRVDRVLDSLDDGTTKIIAEATAGGGGYDYSSWRLSIENLDGLVVDQVGGPGKPPEVTVPEETTVVLVRLYVDPVPAMTPGTIRHSDGLPPGVPPAGYPFMLP